MKREKIIKFKVSEEENKTIEENAAKGGFASVAAYARNQCLAYKPIQLVLWQKCEIRDSLQEINRITGNNPQILSCINKINGIIDKVGE